VKLVRFYNKKTENYKL